MFNKIAQSKYYSTYIQMCLITKTCTCHTIKWYRAMVGATQIKSCQTLCYNYMYIRHIDLTCNHSNRIYTYITYMHVCIYVCSYIDYIAIPCESIYVIYMAYINNIKHIAEETSQYFQVFKPGACLVS